MKKSGLANNTIVAITGDHAVRGLTGFQGSALRNVAVPLYMYVPDAYKPVQLVELDQLALHKDIMPTLYHLALSEATYPNLGRNIFNTLENSEHQFAVSARYLAVETGVVLKDRPTMVYPFVHNRRLVLGEPKLLIDHDEGVHQKFLSAMAYDDLVDWMMRYQLVGGN